MRKQKTVFFAVLFCIVVTVQIEAKENKTKKIPGDWELAQKEGNVSVYYRWISIDTARTREMKAEFTIEAEVAQILPYFSEPENYYSWAAGVKECKIKKFGEDNWVTYTLMNYPWPFKQRDLVTRHMVSNSGDETIVSISADPDFYAREKGIERIQRYRGQWKFRTNEKGFTEVDYCIVSFEKPVFPRFIQDPVIRKLFIDSLQDLKQMAEAK